MMRVHPCLLFCVFLGLAFPALAERAAVKPVAKAVPAVETAAQKTARLVAAAQAQVGVTTGYDPAYVKLAFPNGDVPLNTGVCADVVVRAFRAVGLDLQALLNADMKANFKAYPQKWKLKKPDSNIDHRRVANLMRWFERQGMAVPAADGGNGKTEKRKSRTGKPKAAAKVEEPGTGAVDAKAGGTPQSKISNPQAALFLPGDVVAWDLNGNGLLHIGVVSGAKSADGKRCQLVHNIGRGAQQEDVLESWTIIGHYRPFP